MRRFAQFILFVFLLSSAVAALYVWKTRREAPGLQRRSEQFTAADAPAINLADVNVLAALSQQQTKLAAAVIPSVVSISTQRAARQMRDPFQELLENMFGRGRAPQQQSRIERSLGSGVIVSKEGHILTNNHVIAEMDAIEVQLHDGRKFAARVIGAAPDNDLAVLKIDAAEVRPLALGNSDEVLVGENVFAVGNPFGLEETLTRGIISAKGRRGQEGQGELFQTDAAINPGNSGGALINVRGELIGINTAILASREGGGWQGIGFAIPSSTAKRILESILKNGRVIRGYLGVTLEEITPASAQDLGLKDARGVLVAAVATGSPAEAGGMKPRDVITKFNGKDVRAVPELRERVAEAGVDNAIPIEVVRAGKPEMLNVTVKEMPADFLARSNPNPNAPGAPSPGQPPGTNPRRGLPNPFARPQPGQPAPPAVADSGTLAGIVVIEATPQLLSRFRLPANVRGVVVHRLAENSPAAEVLEEGDLIEEIGDTPITSVRDWDQARSSLPAGRDVLLSIIRGRVRSFVVVKAP